MRNPITACGGASGEPADGDANDRIGSRSSAYTESGESPTRPAKPIEDF
jgi:hypothetical protein